MNPDEMSLKEFIKLPNTIAFHVIDSANLRRFVEERPFIHLGRINAGGHAIIYFDKNRINEVIREIGPNRINVFPSVLGLLGKESLDDTGITQVQNQPYLDLRGSGVLLGFVDTGIDYTNKTFIYEDGTSKILNIWDQTIEGESPEGYYFGSEYKNEQINEALKQKDPFTIVPHKDTNGHGTFLASIAGGRETGDYIGVAPDAEIIAVKIKKASKFNINRNLVPPEQENVFESTDVLLGIEYLVETAIKLGRPLSICIGIGTNIGGHDGFDVLEEYISVISSLTGICVCTAAGNESYARHHTNGRLVREEESHNIEVRVEQNSSSFPIYLWNDSPDRISVAVRSPSGEVIGPVIARTGAILNRKLILEKSRVIIQYILSVEGSGSQYTLIKIIDPTPGIWNIIVYGDVILNGRYNAWLPITELVSPGISFLSPTPNYTIVIPSTSVGSITCGAYNVRSNSLYFNSSWGPTRNPNISPDLVAPGVNVEGIYPNNRLGRMTGTSVASSITAGSCALMFQWGIIEGNDINLNTFRIRAYLIRGCVRDNNMDYPNSQWGFGRLNLLNVFRELR